MKRIADTLGVARSNLMSARLASVRSVGRRPAPAMLELTGDIRRLVDARPTYGYRRIAALLKRERRAAGLGPGQRQARLPADEEARPAAGPAYRPATPART